MRATGPKWLRNWLGDERGNVSLLCAGSMLGTIATMGAALDYSAAANAHTRLQASSDSAVFGVAYQAGQDGAAGVNNIPAYQALAQKYLSANGPSGAAVAEFHACLVSGGDCSTSSGKALNVGQIFLQATANSQRLFGATGTSAASPVNVKATSVVSAALWPQNLTFNMVGAKGWYYKTVTLYVLPSTDGVAANAYKSLATWTYQPTNLGSPSGANNFNVGTDTANGLNNIHASNLGSGYGGLTGPSSVTLGEYADFFLAMDVMLGPCPSTKPWLPSNWSSNSYSFPSSCYATNPNPKNPNAYTQESVGYTVCTENENTSLSNAAFASYNAICNPNSGASAQYNSSSTNTWQFMFVNFYPQQQNANLNGFSHNVPLMAMFPCGTTVGHEWEDGGSMVGSSYNSALASAERQGTYPQQDIFYTVQTSCSQNAGMADSGYTPGGLGGGNTLVQ